MGHVGVPIEPGGHFHGVLGVALNAQTQGFETLQQHETVERADRWTPVTKTLHSGPQGKGDVALVW